MKKIYLFTLVAFAFSTLSHAQFYNDNLDTYTAGAPVGTQTTNFVAWGGDPAVDPDVSDAFAASAPNSLLITNDGTSDDDTIMDLGNQVGGQYTLAFSMYLPSGKTGFYGMMQTNDSANPVFTTTVYPNFGGAGLDQIRQGGALIQEGQYFTPDQWNRVVHHVDLDLDTLIIFANGTEIYNGSYNGDGSFALGGVDLWCPDSATCETYFDDYVWIDGILSNESFEAAKFVAYPNPVQNELKLSAQEAITSVSVYNVLGQEIYRANVNALSTTIDTSSFTSGAYFVKVNVNGTEGTVKILK